jgi:hypothetical protein
MTTALFSQLVSELTGAEGPSRVQKTALEKSVTQRSLAQNAGLCLFWRGVVSNSAKVAAKIDPSSILAIMATLPEAQNSTEDFIFI